MTILREHRIVLNVFEDDSLIYQNQKVFEEEFYHVMCDELSLESYFQDVFLDV